METKKKKKILLIAGAVVLLLVAALGIYLLSGLKEKNSLNYGQIRQEVSDPKANLSDGTVDSSITIKNHKLVAENDLYELYLYEPALSIIIRNKESGALMESAVGAQEDLTGVNETWKGFLQSGIVVEVQEDTNTIQKKLGLEASKANVTVNQVAGGFNASIDYGTYQMGFELQVRLYDDGSVTAYIPESSIYEEAPNKKIGNIYVFPLLGKTKLGEVPGYMFIPDGNGALINLEDKQGRYNSGYVQKVYGSDIGVGESYVLSLLWEQFPAHNESEKILAPIYGMVHTQEQMGYLAVIEGGEEEASILATPNGAYSQYNWVASSFRKCATYIQPTSNSGGSVTKVTDRIGYDIKIRYLFVDGEEANYTGLAKRYREYLVEKGELSEKEDDFQIRLDFLGSDVENWLMFKKPVPVTTVENIREIYQDLQTQEVTEILSLYKGWQAGGIYDLPVTEFKVESELVDGGKGDLKDLIEETKEAGIDFYLYVDTIRGNTDTANTTFDTVKKMDKRLYQETNYKNVYRNFVFWTPQKSSENLKKLSKNLLSHNVGALAISGMSNNLFTYTLNDTMQTRAVTKYIYEEAIKETAKEIELMLEEPIQAYWQYSKGILDMPVADSDYIYTDQSIPFLSIALKGMIPMYGNYINFEANEREYFLKLVETGIYPSFYITYENPAELIYSNSSNVYSAQYSVYRDSILTYYNELKEVNAKVAGASISGHQAEENGLTTVTYDNGVKIYINYSEQEISTEGVTIPALSYKVGEAG